MSIKVRYFASLKEQLGRAEDDLVTVREYTVSQVWSEVNPGLDMPDNVLIAVNMAYVDQTAVVKDGDEVAFFPPVTGGER